MDLVSGFEHLLLYRADGVEYGQIGARVHGIVPCEKGGAQPLRTVPKVIFLRQTIVWLPLLALYCNPSRGRAALELAFA
jgi:hypothetical protein